MILVIKLQNNNNIRDSPILVPMITKITIIMMKTLSQDPEDLRSLTKWNSNELVANHYHHHQCPSA